MASTELLDRGDEAVKKLDAENDKESHKLEGIQGALKNRISTIEATTPGADNGPLLIRHPPVTASFLPNAILITSLSSSLPAPHSTSSRSRLLPTAILITSPSSSLPATSFAEDYLALPRKPLPLLEKKILPVASLKRVISPRHFYR